MPKRISFSYQHAKYGGVVHEVKELLEFEQYESGAVSLKFKDDRDRTLGIMASAFTGWVLRTAEDSSVEQPALRRSRAVEPQSLRGVPEQDVVDSDEDMEALLNA